MVNPDTRWHGSRPGCRSSTVTHKAQGATHPWCWSPVWCGSQGARTPSPSSTTRLRPVRRSAPSGRAEARPLSRAARLQWIGSWAFMKTPSRNIAIIWEIFVFLVSCIKPTKSTPYITKQSHSRNHTNITLLVTVLHLWTRKWLCGPT